MYEIIEIDPKTSSHSLTYVQTIDEVCEYCQHRNLSKDIKITTPNNRILFESQANYNRMLAKEHKKLCEKAQRKAEEPRWAIVSFINGCVLAVFVVCILCILRHYGFPI